RTVFLETRQKHRHHRRYQAFATATTHHQPRFPKRALRGIRALRVLPIDRLLLFVHRQREENFQKHTPAVPRGAREPRLEQIRVVHRLDNVHDTSRTSGACCRSRHRCTSFRAFAGALNKRSVSISTLPGQSFDFTWTNTTSVEPTPITSNAPRLA